MRAFQMMCTLLLLSESSLFSGQDVVLVKSGRRICGSGAGLANAPIAQNKAYFEIKLQSTGGLALFKMNYP